MVREMKQTQRRLCRINTIWIWVRLRLISGTSWILRIIYELKKKKYIELFYNAGQVDVSLIKKSLNIPKATYKLMTNYIYVE